MNKPRYTYMKNILIPCLLFSGSAGVFTGIAVFAFRIAAEAVISLSENLYAMARQAPLYIPLLLCGIALLGSVQALILRFAPACRGGGIPTAVAALRGLIRFDWLKSVFSLFASSMLTYLGGVPLGTEGPCVQMGAAIGRGTVRIFGKSNRAWDRYIMTGGACAGFAAATGAPVSGIFFAFEEAHRRFSPMLFMTASTAVLTGTVTTGALCELFDVRFDMFSFAATAPLPFSLLWAALTVGLIAGLVAILFTQCYRAVGTLLTKHLGKLPDIVKLVLIFTAVALMGFVSAELLGSGHHMIEVLVGDQGVWYLLLLYLCVRAITLCFATQAGSTGGLFLPSLCFGAIIGALCATALVSLQLLPRAYYSVMVIVGMASFLGASARTPITAITFAAEALLCGFTNIIPVVAGVTISFLVIETLGVTAFNETVIENKVAAQNKGKSAHVVDAHLTVRHGTFVVGKEIRDILWPPSCVILSVDKSASNGASHTSSVIAEGDVLHVHYRTYDPPQTAALLEALLGEQDADPAMYSHVADDNHRLPEQ